MRTDPSERHTRASKRRPGLMHGGQYLTRRSDFRAATKTRSAYETVSKSRVSKRLTGDTTDAAISTKSVPRSQGYSYANGRFASGARLGLGTWLADGIECELAF